MAKFNTLILGAGPAGMSCAIELFRSGKEFIIVEKSSQVGGLARTMEFIYNGETWRTDNGPHRFFSKNKYLYDFIQDLLGEHWIIVNRFTRFFINGKFFLYPVNITNALLGLGPIKAFRLIMDYFVEKIKKSLFSRPPDNFEEYAISTFGRTLAEFNILNYTEKIWGLPCSEISADWATQRIKGLSVFETIKNSIFKSKGTRSLVDQFYYPDNGTGLIYEAMWKRIESDGKKKVILNSRPAKITHEGKKIISVTIEDKFGKQNTISVNNLVSSIPITEFVDLLSPPVPAEVKTAISQLRFRSQAYLFMLIDKPSVTKDNWIYFPDKEVPFGRISEMKNFSKKMSPPNKTSLFIEFFCDKGDPVWNSSKEELFELAMPWLEKLHFVNRSEVLTYYTHKIEAVYPIYDLTYQANLSIVKNHLNKFTNLLYNGRPGRFKYNNQDHSIEMGILAGRSLIEEKAYNLEDIGAGNEYFEKGYLPEKLSG